MAELLLTPCLYAHMAGAIAPFKHGILLLAIRTVQSQRPAAHQSAAAATAKVSKRKGVVRRIQVARKGPQRYACCC